MNSSPSLHVATYQRLIDAFNANDLSVVSQVMSPELVYTLPGRSALAGTTYTLPEHLGMLRKAKELSQGTLRLTPRAKAVDGDFLFVWGTIHAVRGAQILEAEHCVMYRFADGQIVQGRTIPTDLYAFDEFWGVPGDAETRADSRAE